MGRLDEIVKYKQNQEITENNKRIQEDQEKKSLVEQIQQLKPRIDQLLEIGNACRDAQIPLTGRAWGSREGYDTNQFVTNSWSHLVGFVDHGTYYPLTQLGINGGGACGVWNFRTNGVQVYEEHEHTTETLEPQIGHMKRFLNEFDKFEKSFYDYVDKLVEKNKDIIPLEDEMNDVQRPIEVSSNRLSVLAYNAIVLLENNGYAPEDFIYELGITSDEYKAIVGRDMFGKEQERVDTVLDDAGKKTSLNEQISSAVCKTPDLQQEVYSISKSTDHDR